MRERTAVERRFRIWVDGRLSDRFTAGFVGVEQRDEEGVTVLSGEYVDESHLQGVLERLRDLGIRVHRFDVGNHRYSTDDGDSSPSSRPPEGST